MAISNLLSGLAPKGDYRNWVNSFGPKPKTPVAGVVAPPATQTPPVAPKTATVGGSGGMGAYKGVNINPGTQEQIQAQMSAIDNPAGVKTGGVETKTKIAPQPKPKKSGLFKDVPSSLTYPGLVGGIVGAARPSATQTGLVSDLSKTAKGNAAIAENARKISEQYGQQIAKTGALGAGAVAGNLSTGTNLVGSGNAAIASQSASQRMSALSAAQQAALAGTGQQLTAQQQQAGALGAALGGANTQQAQQLSGLGSAAGYAQPSQNFPFVFNPLTGGYTTPGVAGQGAAAGGLTYNPTADAQTFAQQVINHQIPYADAVRALGYAGATAEGLLQQAITQGGGNLTQLQAQTGIQGTQEQQVAAYESALQQGQNLQSQLSDLISTFGLNPNDLNAANVAIQAIAKNTSDARYALLKNYITDVANTYAQVLTPPGGSPTDYTTSIAQSMLDGTASGHAIQEVMRALDQAAQAKIAGVRTITPSGNTGGQTVQTSVGTVNTNW